MTKPIEWTTTEPQPARDVHHVLRVRRRYNDGSHNEFPATPADLSAALTAMGEGERAEVLTAFHGDSIVHRHLRERVEAAERERDRMAREFGTCPGELPDDGEIARFVRERAEFRARAEKAERERDEARNRNAQRDRDWDVIRTLTDAGAGFTVAAVRRVVSERDEFRDCMGAVADQRTAETLRANRAEKLLSEVRGERDDLRVKNDGLRDCLKERKTICEDAIKRAEAAERERDEARLELERARASLATVRHDLAGTRTELQEAREARDRSTRLRDAMMPDTRAALDAEQYEDALTAARRVVAERESLRSRLIAAETAAAQREPREYPLAEGSRWEGDCVRGNDGYELLRYLDGLIVVTKWGRDTVFPIADVLALAHRRGLL